MALITVMPRATGFTVRTVTKRDVSIMKIDIDNNFFLLSAFIQETR